MVEEGHRTGRLFTFCFKGLMLDNGHRTGRLCKFCFKGLMVEEDTGH
jgi:hypothetical protein